MALQLTAPGAPLELRDVPRPVPAADQVLVQVAGCGVCHTDIGFWKDGVPTKKALPLTLGHEVAGTIVEAGTEFRQLVGRDVIVPAVIPCGRCDLCRSGRGNVCRFYRGRFRPRLSQPADYASGSLPRRGQHGCGGSNCRGDR